MKLQHYPIQLFNDTKFESKAVVQIPVGSKFKEAKILPDGIFVFYEVPELDIEETKRGVEYRTEAFYTLKPNETIPEDHEFITILDTIINSPNGQSFVLFPVYKKVENEESELVKSLRVLK